MDIPFPKPIRTAIHDMRLVGCILLELETDCGLTGESLVFSLNAAQINTLHGAVLDFASLVTGRDPHYLGAIREEIWNKMNPVGHKGPPVAALSAMDTACWDLVGKATSLPLHRVYGACRDRVRTYASGGLWLSSDIGELVQEAGDFLEQGFRAMKIRLGSAETHQDVARVRAVREAIGPQVELLADLNQGLTVKQAIRLGRELEEFDIGWLEEPVSCLDIGGHAEVRAALTMPVASGETEYTRFGMHEMLRAAAVDVLMPDLQRIGGLSEFRRAAAIASVYHVPVSSHLFTEQSLCVAASEGNCISVEHMPWFSPLYNEPLVIEEGFIEVPDRPGLGFTFNHDAISTYRVD